MSKFIDWLQTEWQELERREGKKYSTRRLSMEAGLSANTLYQLLNHPDVKPSPETCHKLAGFFDIDPLTVLTLAGHVDKVVKSLPDSDAALLQQRRDLRHLLQTAQELATVEVQILQQMADEFVRRRRQEQADVAQGAAVALVVEDMEDSRMLFANMLELAGLKVLQAKDGQHAVEVIEATGALIDVVLMDYRMPRMNGVEATKIIRQHHPELPILFVSAWDDDEMKEEAFAAGAAEYLVSPVDFDELVTAVSRVRQSVLN